MTEKLPDIPRLAYAYHRLVLWVGAHLLLFLAWYVFLSARQFKLASIDVQSGTPEWAALLIVNLVTLSALAYYGYRTAEALGSRVSLLWAVAMVVPGVIMISLLALSYRAAAICRANGIPVGFFGPKLSSQPPVTTSTSN